MALRMWGLVWPSESIESSHSPALPGQPLIPVSKCHLAGKSLQGWASTPALGCCASA